MSLKFVSNLLRVAQTPLFGPVLLCIEYKLESTHCHIVEPGSIRLSVLKLIRMKIVRTLFEYYIAQKVRFFQLRFRVFGHNAKNRKSSYCEIIFRLCQNQFRNKISFTKLSKMSRKKLEKKKMFIDFSSKT
jgi:hypothetical protein